MKRWMKESKDMKQKVKYFLHSLTTKWIIITCIVVLPINILTAVIAGLMNRSYQENLIASYTGQLAIYGERVDAELSHMKNIIQNFLDIYNLSKLTLGSKTDSTVEVTRFKNNLTGSNIWGTYPGICYVWDKEKDIVSFFHQGQNYSRDITDLLDERIMEKRMAGENYEGWVWVSAGDKAFLAQCYDFPYFSFGILLDAEIILKEFYEAANCVNSCIYLADSEGTLLACYMEEGFEILLEDWAAFGNMSETKTEIGIETASGIETVFGISENKNQIVLTENFAFDSYQLVHAMERSELTQSLPAMMVIIYILTICSFISIPLVCILAVRLVIVPLKRLVEAMGKLEKGNLEYQLEAAGGSAEMDFIYLKFNHMTDELNRLVKETYEKEIEKLQADAVNMRLQVNQHMLLNFLNTIYSLSQVGKNEQIGDFSLLLMKYFRYVLRQDITLVTVKEEMEFVQDYLKIQKVRFPDSFTWVYSVDEEAEGILIPQLLIENFVENTVKYGLVMGSEIEIIINVRVESSRLLVSICDTGNGMTAKVLKKLRDGEAIEDRNGKHIGIWNCRRRLKYYYGEEYRMEITSGPGTGTQIWIEMPTEPLESGEAARKIHLMEQREK